ncbi:MAG: class I SAM-dependent methyltransferase [Mycobacterium sp.]
MARTDGDSWDLTSGVGATATMVAAGRALATKDPRRLIDDRFAEPLVRAVGIDFFVKMIDGTLESSPFGDTEPERVQAMIAGMAMRTKFFDDYFISTCVNGDVRQAVILASGLDSRAYRLHWPPGTVVYEIDQPGVIDFKTGVLNDLGAQPIAQCRTVGMDLRGDWPTALRAAGFDPGAPTAWLAEGLLIYLPPDAQDRLFDTITALSAPGSAVATEYASGIIDFDAAKVREMAANMRARGLDIEMPDLIYPGPRSSAMDYLGATGWQVTATPGDALFIHSGLRPPDRGDYDPLGEIVYVSAGR